MAGHAYGLDVDGLSVCRGGHAVENSVTDKVCECRIILVGVGAGRSSMNDVVRAGSTVIENGLEATVQVLSVVPMLRPVGDRDMYMFEAALHALFAECVAIAGKQLLGKSVRSAAS